MLLPLLHLGIGIAVLGWLAGAALVRVGGSLLDRLVLSLVGGFGILCAAGFLWAWWPWHLQPWAVGGTVATVLAAAVLVTGRTPALPRPALPDVGALTVSVLVGLATAVPYLRHGAAGRAAILVGGDDDARHLALVNTIRQVGGFLYLKGPVPELLTGMPHYPQGLHLGVAVGADLWHSSAVPTSSYAAMDDFIAGTTVAVALTTLLVLWAALRLAGARRGVGPLPAVVLLGATVLLGPFSTLHQRGYDNEWLSLGLTAVLAALAARPDRRHLREQGLLVGAALVGVAYAHFLALPVAAVAALVWLVRCWPRRSAAAARQRIFLVLLGILAAALAAVPVLLVPRGGTEAINAGGPVVAPRATVVVILAGCALLGLATARRSRSAWCFGIVVLAATVLAVALGGYQSATTGTLTYYLAKTIHCVVLLLVVAVAATLTTLLEAGTTAGRAHRGPALVAAGVLSIALAATALLPQGWQPDAPKMATTGQNFGVRYLQGRLSYPRPAVIGTAVATHPGGADAPVDLVWRVAGYGPDYYATQILIPLEGDYDDAAEQVRLAQRKNSRLTEQSLFAVLSSNDRPKRVLTDQSIVVGQVAAFRAAHPGIPVSVLLLPRTG